MTDDDAIDDYELQRTRNRIFDLRREIENKAHGSGGLSIPSATLLGKVVDGGAIPTEGGRYFLVNPVRAGGEPTEGEAFTTSGDENQRVPVLVLGSRAPKAGDILRAWSVRHRWVAESHGGQCLWTFTTRGCSGGLLPGTFVELYQGGILIASCTTNASAVCTLSAPAGSYDVVAAGPSGGGYDPYSATIAHTCTQSTTITLSLDSVHTCYDCSDCDSFPETIFITFDYAPGSSLHWPDSTLTWDPLGLWWISEVFMMLDGNGNLKPFKLMIQCNPPFNCYELNFFFADNPGDNAHPIGKALFDPVQTCIPFSVPNGRFDFEPASHWSLL